MQDGIAVKIKRWYSWFVQEFGLHPVLIEIGPLFELSTGKKIVLS